MLGNDAGPLRASPNSIVPIPINNQHFEGLSRQAVEAHTVYSGHMYVHAIQMD